MNSPQNVRILLVDDEPALTKLMQTYLARMGYTVDATLCAEEALSLFRANPQDYKLVVADITLPDLAGNDMAIRMAEQIPTSAFFYAADIPSRWIPAEHIRGRSASLQKPFLPNMLAESIQKLLAKLD